MNNRNSVKDKVQKEALTASKKEKNSLVVIATGGGKSKIGIDYAKEIIEEKPDARILIVVPTEKLRDVNWHEEFKQWGAESIWNNNVVRSCYVSIAKIDTEEFDLVILDEAHNITVANSIFFSKNKVNRCIALTATLPEDREKLNILDALGFKKTYTLSLDKAVEMGLVSPYTIRVIELRLNDTDKNVVSGTKAKPFMQTERAKYNYISGMVQKLMFQGTVASKNTLKFKLLERMRFIYNLKTKTDAAKYLLEHVIPQDERTLIFSGSIAQADELCVNSFHSKKKKSDTTFEDFKASKINRMSCVNSVNEGQNIPLLDNGLVVQLNSKKLNLVQRVGRIVRFREGHKANIYILSVIDTQDEKWVNKALSEFDKECIVRHRFENIVNGSEVMS